MCKQRGTKKGITKLIVKGNPEEIFLVAKDVSYGL